jgi:hypothetical protein
MSNLRREKSKRKRRNGARCRCKPRQWQQHTPCWFDSAECDLEHAHDLCPQLLPKLVTVAYEYRVKIIRKESGKQRTAEEPALCVKDASCHQLSFEKKRRLEPIAPTKQQLEPCKQH